MPKEALVKHVADFDQAWSTLVRNKNATPLLCPENRAHRLIEAPCDGVVVECCNDCKGLYFDRGELLKFAQARDLARAPAGRTLATVADAGATAVEVAAGAVDTIEVGAGIVEAIFDVLISLSD
jgi:hypothetical protein